MRIIVTPKALAQRKRLLKSEVDKIEQKLRLLEMNPYLRKKLEGKFAGLYTLRAWPYRIIYFIDNKQKTIFAVSILHRQGAYK